MDELRKYKFCDLYKMSSGISSKPEQAGHGAPFLSFRLVFQNYFLPEELEDKMDTSAKEQATYSIKEGDIFLTRTSETIDELGMSSVALKDYPTATFSGFLKRLRPIQTDITYHKYLAFYLRSKLFRKTMTNNAIMTLRASLNEQIFSYLELLLPNYNEQKKIGDFLHVLNQKIKLNNRINRELEGMAKLLYDYWFVQFDFPNSEAQAEAMGKPELKGKPYKSSGGPMVYNEELKREVPEGWGVQTLDKWIEKDKSGDWGKDEHEGNHKLEVSCIRGADLNGLNGNGALKCPTRFILEKNNHKLLAAYDLIVEISGGSPTQSTGRMAFITDETLKRFEKPLICSNFCKAVTLKHKRHLFYFTQLWKSIYNNDILFGWEGKTSGIKNLLFDSFVRNYAAALPPDLLVEKFFNFIKPAHSKIQKNLAENQHLKNLRDWLLPMLMNGQVKVSSGESTENENELSMAAEEEEEYG